MKPLPIPKEVEQVLRTYPVEIQRHLLEIRKLIFEVADEIGGVEETLKWQEPSYFPLKKSSRYYCQASMEKL